MIHSPFFYLLLAFAYVTLVTAVCAFFYGAGRRRAHVVAPALVLAGFLVILWSALSIASGELPPWAHPMH